MRVLVFQHIAVEHPGVFRDYLGADGDRWDAVALDEGEPIPSLDGYDALWVMGGPMDVWEEDSHPWLAAEKAAIREAVIERRLPFLGICLGHQLLAAALGGRCAPAAAAEVGFLDVTLTEEGQRDPLFAGLPSVTTCFQWHGAEVSTPPPGAVILATSPVCGVQAMRVGTAAYGLQYHVEITADSVSEWSRVPAYAAALEAAMGPGALAGLEAETRRRLGDLHAMARRLYANFRRLACGSAPAPAGDA